MLMAPLNVTRLALLLKIFINNKELIIVTLSMQRLNQLRLKLFYPLIAVQSQWPIH
jgi:hypothetical protein